MLGAEAGGDWGKDLRGQGHESLQRGLNATQDPVCARLGVLRPYHDTRLAQQHRVGLGAEDANVDNPRLMKPEVIAQLTFVGIIPSKRSIRQIVHVGENALAPKVRPAA